MYFEGHLYASAWAAATTTTKTAAPVVAKLFTQEHKELTEFVRIPPGPLREEINGMVPDLRT